MFGQRGMGNMSDMNAGDNRRHKGLLGKILAGAAVLAIAGGILYKCEKEHQDRQRERLAQADSDFDNGIRICEEFYKVVERRYGKKRHEELDGIYVEQIFSELGLKAPPGVREARDIKGSKLASDARGPRINLRPVNPEEFLFYRDNLGLFQIAVLYDGQVKPQVVSKDKLLGFISSNSRHLNQQ
jgi:hypothetical protein